jgi:hypothetical protein
MNRIHKVIGDRNTPIPVRLNNKRVGTIKPVEGG